MRRYIKVPLAFFLGVSALGRAAAADDKDTAKTAFEQGVKQMEAKDYEHGCPALEQSQKLDPRPGTLFTLAECEALRGRSAAAYTRYGEYLQVYASLPRDKQQKQGTREKDARTKRAELEKLIAQATLALPPGAPPGTVVARDGATLDPGEINAPMMLDPGEHVVTTQAPGGPLTEQRFKLEKGEKRTITLEVRAAAPVKSAGPVEPPPPPSSNGRRIATFVVGGLGVAGLITGGVTGGLMLSKMDAIKAGCKDGAGGVQLCNTEGASAGNSAKLLGAIATAGFVTGAVGLGVAVVLFATAPGGAGARPAQKKGGLEIRAMAMGPLGTMVGVQGSF